MPVQYDEFGVMHVCISDKPSRMTIEALNVMWC